MVLKLTVIVGVALCAGAIEVRAGSAGNGSGSNPQPVYRNDSTPLPASLKLSAEPVGADGKRCGYIGHSGDEMKVVVGDEQSAAGLQIRDFMFSPDGSHYAFSMVGANNGPWVEVFDGKPQTIEYVSEPKNPTFSSDG